MCYSLRVDKDSYGMPKDWPFAQLYAKRKSREEMLDHKTIVGRYEVSTVELAFNFMGQPNEYETMVFDNETGETDVMPHFSRRFGSAEEALRHHADVVNKIQAEVDAYEIVKRG